MGKKRRREKSEERIHRKIRKLEEKLKQRKGVLYSSDDEPNGPPQTTDRDPTPEVEFVSSPVPEPPAAPAPELSVAPAPLFSSSVEPELTSAGTVIPEETEEIDLDDDILQLLGEAPEPETIFGKAVHKNISARWQDILKKGLCKDTKEKKFKDYVIPSNCELLVPPVLNPEAKAALTDSFIKRDASMVSRQRHLSVAIAALTQTVDKIVCNKDYQTLKQDFLKPISDACRIMCDMHHYETKIRKKFVISSINFELKDALSDVSTDKFLFGENMSEKLKNAKTIQKSGEALKVVQKPAVQRNYIANKTNNYNNKNRGNPKTLHQKRPDAGRNPIGQRYQASAAYPRGRASARSPPPPPLPPPPPPPSRRQIRR